MKHQLNLFFHALQFYSRIPVGKIDYSEENLTQSLRFFPLVGIIVGAVGAIIFILSNLVFPQSVSVVATIISMVAITGALHEDGVSDFFDGFGGGYTKERILEIMKDSYVGAYGVIALIFLFLAKFALLLSIETAQLPVALIAAHASSRFMAVLLVKSSTYARMEQSKSSHSRNPLSHTTFITALVLSALPLFLVSWVVAVSAIVVYLIIFFALKRYVDKKIGGFTGDILGTMQQFCEIAFYATYVGVIAYI
ncbi:MAG: adenosylcobinamide-GDP ribazoletransferase [Bacteroidia bacterium]|nr:adenosylcobinamide-GDP ribazoletransferase [Bacteroidia bacterium]